MRGGYTYFCPVRKKFMERNVSASRCRPSFVPRQKKAKALRSKGEMARLRFYQRRNRFALTTNGVKAQLLKHTILAISTYADFSPLPRRLTSHTTGKSRKKQAPAIAQSANPLCRCLGGVPPPAIHGVCSVKITPSVSHKVQIPTAVVWAVGIG